MKKIYLVYMSFPYTEDPKGTAREIAKIAKEIYTKHHDLVLLIPHFMFDAIWDFPTGYTIPNIATIELALIKRLDIFAYEPSRISSGVTWEKAFAEVENIPILTYQQLMEGERPI